MATRALSTLIATIILVAITVSTGIVIYLMASGWMNVLSPSLNIQVEHASLTLAGDKALLSVSVKNTGNRLLVGMVASCYDDGGKCLKLALPPSQPRANKQQHADNTVRHLKYYFRRFGKQQPWSNIWWNLD